MILVTGATGFVGSHLVTRLRKDGLAVRAVVRTPAKAQALADLGVEVVPGDISDRASLEAAAAGIERVIHLVGIIQEAPGATFQSVHVDGTRELLEASKKAGVRHFIYQSALGTRPNAKSRYHRTKWEAEELVSRAGFPLPSSPFAHLRPRRPLHHPPCRDDQALAGPAGHRLGQVQDPADLHRRRGRVHPEDRDE